MLSSVVEQCVYTASVGGSNPSAPTQVLAPRLAGSQMVSYIHPKVGFNPQGEYMANIKLDTSATPVSCKIKSKRTSLTKTYNEAGHIISEDWVEEIEYENGVVEQLTQPYYITYATNGTGIASSNVDTMHTDHVHIALDKI